MDLEETYKLMRIVTFGRNHSTTRHWVTEYRLYYSLDNITWTQINYSDTSNKFPANTNRETPVEHNFSPPIVARFVRLNVTDYREHIALRWELYGVLNSTQHEGLYDYISPDSKIIR